MFRRPRRRNRTGDLHGRVEHVASVPALIWIKPSSGSKGAFKPWGPLPRQVSPERTSTSPLASPDTRIASRGASAWSGCPRYVSLACCVEAVLDGRLCTDVHAAGQSHRAAENPHGANPVADSARYGRAVALSPLALLGCPRGRVSHQARGRKECKGAQQAPHLGLELLHFPPPDSASFALSEAVLSNFDRRLVVSGVPLLRNLEAIVFSPTPYFFAHSRSVRVLPPNV